MKIAVINGSPKKNHGATRNILDIIKSMIQGDMEEFSAIDYLYKSDAVCENAIDQILSADVLLIASPLYVDALPMPLITFLQSIEKKAKVKKHSIIKVYGIIHCGFFDAIQNKVALEILQHFCVKSEFKWQYGLGIGAGVLIDSKKDLTKGPMINIHEALQALSKAMMSDSIEKSEDVFVQPSIPRFAYLIGGNIGWKMQAKSFSTKRKLRFKPFT